MPPPGGFRAFPRAASALDSPPHMNPAPPDLRSPADTVGGIVYFGRLLDKVRLHATGRLPEDLVENLGKGFDARCTHFLRVDYAALVERALPAGAEANDDETILEWCFAHGRRPDEQEIEIWNAFMRKRGLKDDGTPTLERRKRESGLTDRADVETMFQYLDADEGRPVRPLG